MAAAPDPTGAGGPTLQVAPAPAPEGGIAGYFAHWFDRVRHAQDGQPHWITPLVTVMPRLEQEVRYDQFREHLPTGASLHDYDTGNGLELIPTTTSEVILSFPPLRGAPARSATPAR